MVPDLVLVLFSDYNRELHGEIQGVLTKCLPEDLFMMTDAEIIQDARINPTYYLVHDTPEHLTFPKTNKIKGGVCFYE